MSIFNMCRDMKVKGQGSRSFLEILKFSILSIFDTQQWHTCLWERSFMSFPYYDMWTGSGYDLWPWFWLVHFMQPDVFPFCILKVLKNQGQRSNSDPAIIESSMSPHKNHSTMQKMGRIDVTLTKGYKHSLIGIWPRPLTYGQYNL